MYLANIHSGDMIIIFILAVIIGAGFRLGWSLIGGIKYWFMENDRKFQQARQAQPPPTTSIPSE